MHVVLFEGIHWVRLAPLSLSRPVFMLACGAGTLLDKQLRALQPDRVTLWVRPEMIDYCWRIVVPRIKAPCSINTPLDDDPALLMSGRTLHFSKFECPNEPAVVLDEDDIVRIAYVRSPGLSHIDAMTRSDKWLKLLDLPRMMPQSRLADYPWDLLNWNEEALVQDSVSMPITCAVHQRGPWHLVNDQNVLLAEEVKIGPGAVLDATNGPVIVGEHAIIGANSVVQGPVYVGPYSQLMPLTYIRPGTTLGPYCKVGGEISNSILQGFVSKSHYGFLGDSFLGEWVNFGAGTTTSNLKNTFDEISMAYPGRSLKTGRRFVGAIVGDHSKTAIGTRLMTGTYIGYNCNLAGSTIPPRFIPSFTWITDADTTAYRIEKALRVMPAVFARRHQQWTPDDATMVNIAIEMAKTAEATA